MRLEALVTKGDELTGLSVPVDDLLSILWLVGSDNSPVSIDMGSRVVSESHISSSVKSDGLGS